MKRRDLFRTVGIGAVAIGALPHWVRAASEEPECEVDVLVIGGGTAGTIAALQAARAGARTMLVEMCGQLGGTTTVGGVAYPGLFHAWEKQVIAGIGWELVNSSVDLDSGTMPDFSVPPQRHSHHQVRVNGQLYAALAEEACLEAGVAICYYEMPQAVEPTGGGWLVRTFGKGMSREIACRQLVDCTGGADVVGMIGLPRLREATTQPGTLMFSFGGYDKNQLDTDVIQQRYREALANGQLHEGDYCHANGYYTFDNEGVSGSRIPAAADYLPHFVIDKTSGKPRTFVLSETNPTRQWKRHSYEFCVADPAATEFFCQVVDRAHELGVDVLQMDQTTSGGGHACYSRDHQHAPGVGRYQTQGFHDLLGAMRNRGKQNTDDFVLFHEEPHEQLIPYVDGFHVREYKERWWYRRHPGAVGIPLFSYLYHEYAIGYGGDSAVLHPSGDRRMVRSHAVNLVTGRTPGGSVWSSQQNMLNAHPDQITMLRNHCRLMQR